MDPTKPELPASVPPAGAAPPPLRRDRSLWFPLLLILLLAAALRVAGLQWGLPNATHLFSYHPDEYHSLRGALALLLAGDPNPHFFNYGSLYLYLVSLAVFFAGGTAPVTMDAQPVMQMMHDWTLAARYLNAALGVATVLVVFLAARDLLGRRFGLLAALALAVFPLHVLHSHYATVDVPQAFFIALTLLFAVRIGKGGTTRDYLWAGVCAGLAASTKYSGALVLITPLIAHFAAPAAERRTPLLAWQPLAMLVLAAGAFAATSPYTFLDWPNAQRDILFELDHMRLGEEPARAADPNGWLFHGLGLTLTTGGATLAALIGLVAALASKFRRAALALIVFAVLWFVMIALANVRYGRYEVGLTPVLALLLAAGPAALARRRVEWRFLAALAAALALGVAASTSSLMALRLQREPDARDVALQAILRHVPPDRTVGLAWEPWFNAPPVDRVNGGTLLRQNALWGQLAQPLRPLAVIGTDAPALEQQQPFAFALTNFEIRDALRLDQPGARAFREALGRLYVPAAISGRPAVLAGVLSWAPPQDWLYPFPEITLHILKAAPAKLAPAKPPVPAAAPGAPKPAAAPAKPPARP